MTEPFGDIFVISIEHTAVHGVLQK